MDDTDDTDSGYRMHGNCGGHMNLKTTFRAYVGVALLLVALGSTWAQGTFRNLDFEQANLSGFVPNQDVPIAQAMPGWSGAYSNSVSGMSLTPEAVYNGLSLGGAMISIFNLDGGGGSAIIQGKNSVWLFSGGFSSPYYSSIIFQTGLVPADARSLRVAVRWYDAPVVTSLGGKVIEMQPLETFPGYVVLGGDISAFAGSTAELRFMQPAPLIHTPSPCGIDSIQFSIEPIPEPGVGLLVLFWGRALARKSWLETGREEGEGLMALPQRCWSVALLHTDGTDSGRRLLREPCQHQHSRAAWILLHLSIPPPGVEDRFG